MCTIGCGAQISFASCYIYKLWNTYRASLCGCSIKLEPFCWFEEQDVLIATYL